MALLPVGVLRILRSSFGRVRFAPTTVAPYLRDKVTGRFVRVEAASRSMAMTRYWTRIGELTEKYPEYTTSEVRRMWKDRLFTEEDLAAHDTSWEDIYSTSPKEL